MLWLEFQWHALMKQDGRLASNQQIKMSLSKWSWNVLQKLSLNTTRNLPFYLRMQVLIYGETVDNVYMSSCSLTLVIIAHTTILVEFGNMCGALKSAVHLSGPPLLLSSDCFCTSQSLQNIRPLFTVTLGSLNSSYCSLSTHRTTC